MSPLLDNLFVRACLTGLGLLSHSALAIGMVAVSLTSGIRIDISALLSDEILIIQGDDLALVWGGVAFVLMLLWWGWSALLTATVSRKLAQTAGVKSTGGAVRLNHHAGADRGRCRGD